MKVVVGGGSGWRRRRWGRVTEWESEAVGKAPGLPADVSVRQVVLLPLSFVSLAAALCLQALIKPFVLNFSKAVGAEPTCRVNHCDRFQQICFLFCCCFAIVGPETPQR